MDRRLSTVAAAALVLTGATTAIADDNPVAKGEAKVAMSVGRGLSLGGVNGSSDQLGTRIGLAGVIPNAVPYVTYDYLQLQVQTQGDRITLNTHTVGLGARYYVRARGPEKVSAYVAGAAFMLIPKAKDNFDGFTEDLGENASNLGGYGGFGGEYLFAPGFGLVGEAGVHRWMGKIEDEVDGQKTLVGAAVTTTYSYLGMVFYF
jgi:hypothetical protein